MTTKKTATVNIDRAILRRIKYVALDKGLTVRRAVEIALISHYGINPQPEGDDR